MKSYIQLMLLVGSCFAQEHEVCAVKELFSAPGWQVPGLAGARPKVSGVRYQSRDDPRILVDILDPSKEQVSIILAYCISNQTNRLEIVRRQVQANRLMRFRIGPQVFAYRLFGAFFAGGVALGSGVELEYYDPDGTGVLSVQRDISGPSAEMVIPLWVGRTAKNERDRKR